VDALSLTSEGVLKETAPKAGGNGWFAGSPESYDREFAVAADQLFACLQVTQPEEYVKLGRGDYRDRKNMARQRCPVPETFQATADERLSSTLSAQRTLPS